MPLRMNSGQIESIRAHAAKSWPAECCGILAGDRAGDSRVVREVWCSPNAEERPRAEERFRIAPRRVWRALSKARDAGLQVVGFYHSHPGRSAVPSRRDAAYAWPGCSSVILEVRRGVPLPPRAWVIPPGGSEHVEEKIILDQDGGPELP